MDGTGTTDGWWAAVSGPTALATERRGAQPREAPVWRREDADPVVRQLVEVVLPAWQQAAAEGTAMSLLLVEPDWFDRYREHYGDDVAEACLVEVASEVAHAAPDGRALYRYEGDHLALVLPGADRAVARGVAEVVRTRLAARRLEHVRARHGVLTASIGVAAAVPAREGDPEDLVARADAALFAAREGGHDSLHLG